MSDLLASYGFGLIIPTVILCVLGWVIPRRLGARYANNLPKLIAVGLVATFMMFLLSGLLFAALYIGQGAPMSALGDLGVGYFITLGRNAALIWGPVMVLSLIGLDKRSRSELW